MITSRKCIAYVSEDKESLSGAKKMENEILWRNSSWSIQIGGTEMYWIGEPEGQWPRADLLWSDRSVWVGGAEINSKEIVK
jgi:hypothetical protein